MDVSIPVGYHLRSMSTYAHLLFGIAGVANLVVAASLLFLRSQIGPLLGLDPVSGTNLVFLYISASFIAVFGYVYLRIAQDPGRYRPFIQLGAIGKLLAVAATAWPWLTGEIGWQLPLVISGDLVFAALFIDFLRRMPPA